MADNATLPATGAVIRATDVGSGILRQQIESKASIAVGTTLTRPANVTAYAALDSISDNATPGSVTAQPITFADVNDAPITLESCTLNTTDTGLQGKNVRAWFYNSDPTASTGVVGGDNLAFSNKKAGFIGSMSGTFRIFSDGAKARLVPDEGARMLVKPGSAAKTIWIQYQTLDAFTPSANSTTIIPTLEGFQLAN